MPNKKFSEPNNLKNLVLITLSEHLVIMQLCEYANLHSTWLCLERTVLAVGHHPLCSDSSLPEKKKKKEPYACCHVCHIAGVVFPYIPVVITMHTVAN